jgi:enterochelin esterase-like enzyme
MKNLRISAILHEKGIQHFLDDRRWCGHDWNYWQEMLPPYLSML